MKLIVVGAAGYIGSPLFELAKSKFETIGTSSSGRNGLYSFRLDEPESFDYTLIKQSDVIMLTAALSAPDRCAKEFSYAWDINVNGTSFFISAALKKGAKVIFFSSDAVYGSQEQEFDETQTCTPTGEYALMKRAVEEKFIESPGFRSIRLSYVFSREDKFTRYLQTCAKQGVTAEVFHPFYRSIIHRDDVTQAALTLAEDWNAAPTPLINFGGPCSISRLDIAKLMQKFILPTLQFTKVEPHSDFFVNRPRIINMRSPFIDRLLGRPARSLEESILMEYAC